MIVTGLPIGEHLKDIISHGLDYLTGSEILRDGNLMDSLIKKNGACPVCGQDCLCEEETVTCERCSIVHHAECWDYIGGCSIYGCDSRFWNSNKNSPAVVEFQQELNKWFEALQSGWQGLGILAAGIVAFFFALYLMFSLQLIIMLLGGAAGSIMTILLNNLHYTMLPCLAICFFGGFKFSFAMVRADKASLGMSKEIRGQLPNLTTLVPEDVKSRVSVSRSYRLGEKALSTGITVAGISLATVVSLEVLLYFGFFPSYYLEFIKGILSRLEALSVIAAFFIPIFFLARFLLRRHVVQLDTIRNRVQITLEHIKDKSS